MTWAITIAIFLGTVVAALLMFLIFSQREQIREALREQRIERRIPAQVLAWVNHSFTKRPSPKTQVVTMPASSLRSAGDRTSSAVRLPRGDGPSRARIAYCNALRGGAFVIGLKFSPLVKDWVTSEPSGHPYRK